MCQIQESIKTTQKQLVVEAEVAAGLECPYTHGKSMQSPHCGSFNNSCHQQAFPLTCPPHFTIFNDFGVCLSEQKLNFKYGNLKKLTLWLSFICIQYLVTSLAKLIHFSKLTPMPDCLKCSQDNL